MRRLLTFAAFLLVLSILPMCAQRNSRGGASHGGFSGSHGGFGSHVVSSGRGFGGSSIGSPHAASSHMNSRPGNGFHEDRFRGHRSEHGFRHRCIGCGYGYGYPYYDPYWSSWWWDSQSSYDEDAAREREIANQMNSENLEEQRMLREQDQDAYARPAYSRSSEVAREDVRAESAPATVLVFRDQHQREIQNYAIVGGMLWNFTPQRTEKIPLTVLDIPATMKANDDRGVDFRLPQASAGQ